MLGKMIKIDVKRTLSKALWWMRYKVICIAVVHNTAHLACFLNQTHQNQVISSLVETPSTSLKLVCQRKETCKMSIVGVPPGPGSGTTDLLNNPLIGLGGEDAHQ